MTHDEAIETLLEGATPGEWLIGKPLGYDSKPEAFIETIDPETVANDTPCDLFAVDAANDGATHIVARGMRVTDALLMINLRDRYLEQTRH